MHHPAPQSAAHPGQTVWRVWPHAPAPARPAPQEVNGALARLAANDLPEGKFRYVLDIKAGPPAAGTAL